MTSSPPAARPDRAARRARGLTVRGWAFLAVAVAVTAAAVLAGQTDLLRVAVLLGGLPLLCLLYLWWAVPQVDVQRDVPEPGTQVGRSQHVTLRIRNPGRLPVGSLLLEEWVPTALGPAPRLVVPALAPGALAQMRYEIRPTRRGRYVLGPMVLRALDPFGLVRLGHPWAGSDTVVVRPRVVPLDRLGPVGALSDVGVSSRLAAAGVGERDLSVREYRIGDDPRHVHWKSSARRGELMVRQEELPHQPRASVLLDVREGEEAAFEWAVEAAASICLRLSQDGYSVRLLTDGHDAGWVGPSDPDLAALTLDRLAVVQAGAATDPAAAARVLASGGDAVVVALLRPGALPEQLLGLTQLGLAALALVPASSGEPAELAALRAVGWSVTAAPAGTQLAPAWSRLVQVQRARAREQGR